VTLSWHLVEIVRLEISGELCERGFSKGDVGRQISGGLSGMNFPGNLSGGMSRGNIRVRNVQDLQHDYKVYTCSV